MPMIHYLLIGHFEHEPMQPEGRAIVRLARHPGEPYARPVLRKPVDMNVVDRIVQEVSGGRAGYGGVGAAWGLTAGTGYLAFDQHTAEREAVVVARRFAREAGA